MYVLYSTWIIVMYYVDLLRATTCFDIERIDEGMPPAYNILLCTGHTNVAEQVLRTVWNELTLLPELLEAVKQNQCMTLSNRMAYDGPVLAVEKVNNKVSHILGGATDATFVSDYIWSLNATERMEEQVNQMFHIVEESADFLAPRIENSAAIRDYYNQILTDEACDGLDADVNPFTGNRISQEGCGYNTLGDYGHNAPKKIEKKIKAFIDKHDILLPRA